MSMGCRCSGVVPLEVISVKCRRINGMSSQLDVIVVVSSPLEVVSVECRLAGVQPDDYAPYRNRPEVTTDWHSDG